MQSIVEDNVIGRPAYLNEALGWGVVLGFAAEGDGCRLTHVSGETWDVTWRVALNCIATDVRLWLVHGDGRRDTREARLCVPLDNCARTVLRDELGAEYASYALHVRSGGPGMPWRALREEDTLLDVPQDTDVLCTAPGFQVRVRGHAAVAGLLPLAPLRALSGHLGVGASQLCTDGGKRLPPHAKVVADALVLCEAIGVKKEEDTVEVTFTSFTSMLSTPSFIQRITVPKRRRRRAGEEEEEEAGGGVPAWVTSVLNATDAATAREALATAASPLWRVVAKQRGGGKRVDYEFVPSEGGGGGGATLRSIEQVRVALRARFVV